MKKITLIFCLIILGTIQFKAQMQVQPLPLDPKVRVGKLDNGLTYFIRHNELPKDRAEFFIAQKVGSVLEEDNQAGLAHFLEHMAFNGTKNFPEKNLISYLETIGVKFGANLNAYTSFDKTVYNISDVPVIREGIIDSCILILHDWSGFISLEEEEIDKERGVIREEMRSYGGASFRQMEKLYPQILPGNQYAKRFPIGTEEVIMNFTPKELRDYYQKWYRPDLQSIIIIGDIDVDQIENKIKNIFSDIPAPINPAERIYYKVDDNKEPIVGIVSDKESTRMLVSVNYKQDPLSVEQKASALGLLVNYIQNVTSEMFNNRIREMIQKANPPFVSASINYRNFASTMTKEAWVSNAIVKDEDVKTALESIVMEIERAKRFGFSASEYDRARTNIVKFYENAYNERDKTKNATYANEYVSYFTDGGFIPGIETEYNMISTLSPQIPVERINEYVIKMFNDENIVLYLICPEKEGFTIPGKEELLAWFNEAKNMEVQPYEDSVSDEVLLSEIPSGGTIVKEEKDNIFDTYNYTLSNGVKVVIKPTSFKDNEILLSATSPGGSSHFPENDPVNIKLYNYINNLGGLAKFSNTDLSKILTGKKVSVYPTIEFIAEGFSGSSSPKDFETMLQLIYLNFTAPRMDEDAYQSFIQRYKSQLEASELSPQIALQDTFILMAFGNSERRSRLRSGDIGKANYNTIMNWRKDRYKDASDFTFTFTGNIYPDSVKTMIAKYIGALPSINRKESFIPLDMKIKSGEIKNHFDKQMENPVGTAINLYSGSFDPNLKNRIKIDMLRQILSILFTEKIREDEGGTYGVGVSGNIANYPEGQTILQISFETEPGKSIYLNNKIHDEIKLVAENGPRMEDFQKVKEFMIKNQQEKEQENAYWSNIITNYYKTGYNAYSNYSETLDSIQPEDIKEILQSLLNQGNLIEVIMNGIK